MKVATTLLRKDNKILLIKKPTGRYGMPGGKAEMDEVPIKAAAREFYEETNLIVKKLSLCAISDIKTATKNFQLYTFYATDFEGELNLQSQEGLLEWIEISKIHEIEMYKGDYDIVNHVLNEYDVDVFKFSYDQNYDLILMEE